MPRLVIPPKAAPTPVACAPGPMIPSARKWPAFSPKGAPGPVQLFYACVHYDPEDRGGCACPTLRHLARGKAPKCVLVAASDDKECLQYQHKEV